MTPQTLGLQIALPELIVRKFLTDYAVCDVKRAGGKVSAIIHSQCASILYSNSISFIVHMHVFENATVEQTLVQTAVNDLYY
jgi:hypothetical protein